MNVEPRGHSLKVIDPNENQNARNKDRSEEIADEWRGIVRKISGQPPKQKGDARKD